MGEHETQVLRPCVLTSAEPLLLRRMVGGIVVRIDIDHIPRSIVIVLVIPGLRYLPCLAGRREIPMFRKVNHMKSRSLRIVRRMVVITVQQGILRSRLTTQSASVIRGLLPAGLPIRMRGTSGPLGFCILVPRRGVAIPSVITTLRPCVIERAETRVVAIKDGVIPRADLREHVKRCTSAFVLRCLACGLEGWDKRFVESQACDMSAGVDTEPVHAHVDEGGITLNQIVIHRRILRVQVHAVTRYLRKPTVRIIPVEIAVVVPVVMRVRRTFHLLQTQTVRVAATEIVIG